MAGLLCDTAAITAGSARASVRELLPGVLHCGPARAEHAMYELVRRRVT